MINFLNFIERTMLPGWIYVGVVIHVLIAIVFICSLLYYHNKANTLAVKVVGSIQLFLIHDDSLLITLLLSDCLEHICY